jgi:uncharacterized protein (DUF433 family)
LPLDLYINRVIIQIEQIYNTRESFFDGREFWSVKKTSHPYKDIITIEPCKRSGKPCIRGLRITVYDVLSYLAAGMTIDEVLNDFPVLTKDDILACLR